MFLFWLHDAEENESTFSSIWLNFKHLNFKFLWVLKTTLVHTLPYFLSPLPSTHTQNLPSSCYFFSRTEPGFFSTHPQITVSRSLSSCHPGLFLFTHGPLQNNARTLLKDSELSISGILLTKNWGVWQSHRQKQPSSLNLCAEKSCLLTWDTCPGITNKK